MMRARWPDWRWLATVISLILAGLIHLNLQAQILPSNVTLAYFDATAMDNAVRLQWGTDTELDLAGFYLERGQNGVFIPLNEIGIIPGEGGTVSGADYEVIDETAVNGNIYVYKLYEIETNGNEIELAEETVFLNGPTATPIVIGSNDPTNTPVPQNTSTASPSSTATASPTATLTVTPAVTTGSRSASPTPSTTSTVANSTLNTPPAPTFSAATPTITDDVSGTTENTPNTIPAPTVSTPDPVSLPPMSVTPDNQIAVDSGVIFAQEGYDAPQGEEAYTPPQNTPIPIGSDRPNLMMPTPATSVPATPAEAGQGRLLLWVGFLLALLIFGSSIVGSIILFTRKQVR